MTLTGLSVESAQPEARGPQDLRAREPGRRRLRRQAGLRRDPGGGLLRQGSRTPGQADPDPRVDVRNQFPANADLSQTEGRPEKWPTRRHEPRHLLRLDGRRASPSARSYGTDWLQLDSWDAKKEDIDQWSIGGSDHWYDVENNRVRAFNSDRTTWAVQASALRTVSNSYNMFVVESFMDEVAHALNRDPVEFRLALLNGKGSSRGIPNAGYAPGTPSDYYMDRLWISLPWPTDKSWPPLRIDHRRRRAAARQLPARGGREGRLGAKKLPPNTGMGIAVSSAEERQSPTWVAGIAEVTVDPKTGRYKINRLTVAMDPGTGDQSASMPRRKSRARRCGAQARSWPSG